MAVLETGSIATTAAVGSNAFAGVFGQASPKARLIKRVALVGSAVVGDSSLDFYIGLTYAGTYRNTTVANAPVEAKDWIPVMIVAEPLEPLNLKLVTAPTTNVMRFFVEYEDLE